MYRSLREKRLLKEFATCWRRSLPRRRPISRLIVNASSRIVSGCCHRTVDSPCSAQTARRTPCRWKNARCLLVALPVAPFFIHPSTFPPHCGIGFLGDSGRSSNPEVRRRKVSLRCAPKSVRRWCRVEVKINYESRSHCSRLRSNH